MEVKTAGDLLGDRAICAVNKSLLFRLQGQPLLTDVSRETPAITHTHACKFSSTGQSQPLYDTHAALRLTGACTCTRCTGRAAFLGHHERTLPQNPDLF